MIPAELRAHMELTIGRSQEQLVPLLARLAPIDFFMHDSEHSYECMAFEFREAWAALRQGGVLVADDVNLNDAFAELAERHGKQPTELGPKMALLVK